MAQSFLRGVDFKKAEITALREALQDALNKRDVAAQIEVMKHVIQAMTSGSDVSELMEIVMMSSQTQNLTLKKMVYLYMQTYAKLKEDLIILVIASLQRDASDKDPRIRGLAIRTLCSLQTPSMIEHMLPALKNGLFDNVAYVRQISCLACIKLYQIAPKIADAQLKRHLGSLTKDKDPHVQCNAIRALDEILRPSGGIPITQELVFLTLSVIHQLNSWEQCYILNLLKNFKPTTDEDLFSILNLLDSRLTHQDFTIVFHTIDFFLRLTETRPELHLSVYVRIKKPILACLVGAGPEAQFVVLRHLLLLSKRVPGLLQKEYKSFFVLRTKDPEYIKIVKVQLLETIASPLSVREIINEFEEYFTDHCVKFGEESIRAVGRLASKFATISQQALTVLLTSLELTQLSHVVATALIVLQDMLVHFPSASADVIPRLSLSLDIVTDPDAVATIVLMLGNYGQAYPPAPYLLHELIKTWGKQKDPVKSALIFATLKIFFHRPQEVFPIVQALFTVALDDMNSLDVHDSALFYSRLLFSDIEKVKKEHPPTA